MREIPPRTEASLVRCVRDQLRADGWDCYLEVRDGYGGPRADIVATRGPVAFVVEAKQRLTIQAVEQALRWKESANQVAVAVWAESMKRDGTPKQGERVRYPNRVLRALGIGLIQVSRYGDIYAGHEEGGARWVRHKPRAPIFDLLNEAQKDTEPGAAGHYYSPFRETCQRLAEYVAGNPGVTLRAALGEVTHHYANEKSARACLYDLIRKGVVDGVTLDEGARLQPTKGGSTDAR